MNEALIVLVDQLEGELDDMHLTHLLINISQIFESVGCSDEPEKDRRSKSLHDHLLSKLATLNARLISNFKNGDVFFTDEERIDPSFFRAPINWEANKSHGWKPTNALWSSPKISEVKESTPISAWTIRATEFGDAIQHDNRIYIERMNKKAVVLDNLEEALRINNVHGSFFEFCRLESQKGTDVIDFTWNLVIEAELAALRGELDPFSYPCGISVESSIWLRPPNMRT